MIGNLLIPSFAACAILLQPATLTPAGEPASGKAALARAADSILALQETDGAITMGHTGEQPVRVIPYFSNLAAIGLVDVYSQTRDMRYLEAARRWAVWYESHMNADGTVNDFTGKPGAWKSTGDYDSTDSYAGTYLELLQAIHRVAPDPNWLRLRWPSVPKALAAIRLTLQPVGMTISKPKWPVMYTMDNTETVRGLRAAAQIAEALGEAETRRQAAEMADRMESAIGKELWDDKRECYRIGIQTTDGSRIEGLSTWYPDIMANLMAIGWLPPSERNRSLLARLKKQFDGDIPRGVNNADDLERLAWWGVAAQGAGDAALLSQIRKRLECFDAAVKQFDNPAILGHVCRLLADDRAESCPD